MLRVFGNTISRMPRRAFSSIKYDAYGSPTSVLKFEKSDHSPTIIKNDEAAIKFLASPINPSDINMIEGVYGKNAKLPAVAGNEGVAVVTEVGSGIKTLQKGDWVIPFASGFGTWRMNAVAKETDLVKVPNDIPSSYAATLSVNPATAYRMLKDGNLKAGDVIMQNGANSMVGLAVIQIAREMGLKTINIIRSDRPEANQVLRLLSNLGGDVNVTDVQVNTPIFREIMSDLPPCKLALNCTGNEVVSEMARCLAPGATMVTYGGMSKRPVTLPFDLIAAKQLKLKGFWMADWYEKHSPQEKTEMMEILANMVRSKKLTFFFEMHDFDDFNYALAKSMEEFQFRKVILNMDYPDRFKEHDSKSEKEYEIFETCV